MPQSAQQQLRQAGLARSVRADEVVDGSPFVLPEVLSAPHVLNRDLNLDFHSALLLTASAIAVAPRIDGLEGVPGIRGHLDNSSLARHEGLEETGDFELVFGQHIGLKAVGLELAPLGEVASLGEALAASMCLDVTPYQPSLLQFLQDPAGIRVRPGLAQLARLFCAQVLVRLKILKYQSSRALVSVHLERVVVLVGLERRVEVDQVNRLVLNVTAQDVKVVAVVE